MKLHTALAREWSVSLGFANACLINAGSVCASHHQEVYHASDLSHPVQSHLLSYSLLAGIRSRSNNRSPLAIPRCRPPTLLLPTTFPLSPLSFLPYARLSASRSRTSTCRCHH
jgi:hypothetical protein